MPREVQSQGLVSLLRHQFEKKSGNGSKGVLKMFKLVQMLTTGCKMAALLSKTASKALLTDQATMATLFGYRRGRLSLAIHHELKSTPVFLIELPIHTNNFHKEMSSGCVRLALESETKTSKKKLLEEHVWAVYCNGRKSGYSIRRRDMSSEERYVMQMLRWVSMGAGVLPSPCSGTGRGAAGGEGDGELTYLRARFQRVVGSKDSEALYMMNPDGPGGNAPDLSIFLVRVK